MNPAEGRGPPSGTAEAKRPVANKPIRVDWHDFLINIREPGKAVAVNFVFRPDRAHCTGFEYKCTTGGVASSAPFNQIRWPRVAAATVTDGSAVWTAQAISSSSLRATVSVSTWTADTGITLASESNDDLIYTKFASGGTDGQDYEIKHQVTLTGTPVEIEEALIILPVRD